MKTRVLLLHNILWSHYKAVVFSELHAILKKTDFELFILQKAVTERQRKGLGDLDLSSHQYPYKLLFTTSMEEIPLHKSMIAIWKELSRREFDVIAIPGYAYVMCWCALIYACLKGKKIIVMFDSTEMDHRHVWYKELLKKFFISRSHAAFCYGTKSKEYLVKLGMRPEDIFTRCQATNNGRIREIHQQAVADRGPLAVEYAVRKYNFIYVGRLSGEKNIGCLLSAFARVKEENTHAADWGLLIVGAGPELPSLQQFVSDRQVPDVCFVGGQSWDTVPRFYALSSVFVLPSLSEPWGLVVNEAMVCGLPVIVSMKCGAAYDIVHEGENGFTFDPLDSDALARHLVYFLDNPGELARMGENSRRIIASYTPQHAAEQMLNGLKAITTGRCRHA